MNNPILFIKDAGHGETPSCPDAIFKRGDVVLVRRCKRLEHVPLEMIVVAAIPSLFPPVWVLADLLCVPRKPDPRPVTFCDVTYFLAKVSDPEAYLDAYLLREKDLTPTGKSVEIGSIKREGAVA
jgi:hypothetical protein